MGDKFQKLNSWGNKQLWRIKATWDLLRPIVGIVQLLLYFLIAVGVNNWFVLDEQSFLMITLVTLIGLNLLGYVLDKGDVLQEHKRREFEIQQPKLYKPQISYGQGMVAYFMRLPQEDLEGIISQAAQELGLEDPFKDG